MTKLFGMVLFVLTLPKFSVLKDGEVAQTIASLPGQFPANVAIQVKSDGNHICSGMLVDLSFIVTTADCISERRTKDLVVFGGTSDMVEIQNVERMFFHPDYQNGSFEYNIAVVKLTKSFTQTTHVHPAVLAKKKPKDNDVCFVAGIAPIATGRAGFAMFYSKVRTMKIELCRKCAENTLCAGNNFHEGGCIEDRGSPLLCNGVLHGIYVGSAENCQTASGLYTDVVFYKDWIKIIMQWNGYGAVPLPDPSARKMQIPPAYTTLDVSGQTTIELMSHLVIAAVVLCANVGYVYNLQ